MAIRPNFPSRLLRDSDRRPTRAAYALPTLFTAGNVFLGFLAIIHSLEGVQWLMLGNHGGNPHWEVAAKMIGIAVVLDGLDGRIARMTNTVSDFGREMDSLADVITFGLAPAILATVWGLLFVDYKPERFETTGYFVAFMFLLAGAVRLARFNVTTNPVPKNPGHPDRKYFVGVPIPAAAGFVAATVYFLDGEPLRDWRLSILWLAVLGGLSFLMVCTWRYRSFKDIDFLRPRTPLSALALGAFIFAISAFSKPMLMGIALLYIGSGIMVRLGGSIRRRLRSKPA